MKTIASSVKVSSTPERENVDCYIETYYYYEQENLNAQKVSIYKVTKLRRVDNDQCLRMTEDRIHHGKKSYIRERLEKYGLKVSITGKRITYDSDFIQHWTPNYDPEKDRTSTDVYVDNDDRLSEMLEKGYVGISIYGDCEEDRHRYVQREMSIREIEDVEINLYDYQELRV